MTKPSPADRLRAALAARGLTPTEAARRMGVARESIVQVLGGRRNPTLDWLHTAALACGIDPAALDDRLASTGVTAP